MIVDDLDQLGTAGCPAETDAELVINTDRMLFGTVALKGFQAIAWRQPQRVKPRRRVQLVQFPPSDCPKILRADSPGGLAGAAVEDILSARISERRDHASKYNA